MPENEKPLFTFSSSQSHGPGLIYKLKSYGISVQIFGVIYSISQ